MSSIPDYPTGIHKGPGQLWNLFKFERLDVHFVLKVLSVCRRAEHERNAERRANVSELRLCFEWVKSGHRSSDCPEKGPISENGKITREAWCTPLQLM